MFFDTHTHLDDERFDDDRHELIESIYKSGVTWMVNIGADLKSSKASVALVDQYDFIYAAVGVHPHDAASLKEADMDTLRELAAHKKVVAIGEIGLDYHYDNAPREMQKKWFRRQIELARELNLPYIVHDRDAHRDAMEVIKSTGYYNGVFHCYSGSAEMAKELIDLGFYISFAGPLTFKNGKKPQEVAKEIPIEKIFIETDSPYLTPEPHRGKRNDSSYVRFVCEKLADIKGISLEEAARITKENGKNFFGI